MSEKLSTVWQAPPHTIAKIEMLTGYLSAWFSILGTSPKFSKQPLWYIDGFAGPGEYENYKEGSPIAALKAAHGALTTAGPRWLAGDIHCVFIEQDDERCENLKRRIAAVQVNRRIKPLPIRATFVDGINELRKQVANPFEPARPLFAFVDPFGPTGLSFAAVRDLLARPACEVLVNLDSDGISRIYRAGEDARHVVHLDDVFGDSSWAGEFRRVNHQSELARAAVSLYKRKLRALPNIRYCFSFEMRSKKQTIDYHLVFASQHPLGLEKMKEAMRKIDQDGSYCFSDDSVGQHTLFRFNDPATHAKQMVKHFRGQSVAYAAVNDYALNESPFSNPKKMLKALEDAGLIVVAATRARKKGTFPEDAQAGMRITFNT
jgi:three-Cys-motif partner protein